MVKVEGIILQRVRKQQRVVIHILMLQCMFDQGSWSFDQVKYAQQEMESFLLCKYCIT